SGRPPRRHLQLEVGAALGDRRTRGRELADDLALRVRVARLLDLLDRPAGRLRAGLRREDVLVDEAGRLDLLRVVGVLHGVRARRGLHRPVALRRPVALVRGVLAGAGVAALARLVVLALVLQGDRGDQAADGEER